ncbi:MAG: hypothetical protein PHP86_02955 [Nevskiales bacterium]|nr:hypothetical protein [Nevskiales bacterium]
MSGGHATGGPAIRPMLVRGYTEFSRHVAMLIEHSRTNVAILTYELDPRLYASDEIVDGFKRFCLSHQRARARILVNQPGRTVKRSNALIDIARMIPSRAEIRQLNEDDVAVEREFVVGDNRCLLYKDRYDQMDARWFEDAPLDALLRLKDFDALWERSLPAREFTTLGI